MEGITILRESWPRTAVSRTIDVPPFVRSGKDDVALLIDALTDRLELRAVEDTLRLSTILSHRVVEGRTVAELFAAGLPAHLGTLSVSASAPVAKARSSRAGSVTPHINWPIPRWGRLLLGPLVPAPEADTGQHVVEFRRDPFGVRLFVSGPDARWVERIVGLVDSFVRRRRLRLAFVFGRRIYLFLLGGAALLIGAAIVLLLASGADALILGLPTRRANPSLAIALEVVSYGCIGLVTVIDWLRPPAVIVREIPGLLSPLRHFVRRVGVPTLGLLAIIVVSVKAPSSLTALLITIATIAQGAWTVYPTIVTQARDR